MLKLVLLIWKGCSFSKIEQGSVAKVCRTAFEQLTFRKNGDLYP